MTGSGSVSRSLKIMIRLLLRIIAASWCRRAATSVSPAGFRLASTARMVPSCVRLLRGGRLVRICVSNVDQADRVLLMDHQVAERRRQADGVLELGQLLPVGVGHRRAQVHDQVAGDVGLGLELLEVILVGLGVDVPVEVLEIVAGDVLAVLGELDGEALKRAGVQAGEEALDDELGPQIEPGDLADDFGPQVFLGGSHAAIIAGSPDPVPGLPPKGETATDHSVERRRKSIAASLA